MSINDWDSNPDNNTTIEGVNIAEQCDPAGINNAIRSIMGAVKEGVGTTLHPYSARLKALADYPAGANQILYLTSPTQASATAFTPFARVLVGAVNAGAARVTLGVSDASITWVEPANISTTFAAAAGTFTSDGAVAPTDGQYLAELSGNGEIPDGRATLSLIAPSAALAQTVNQFFASEQSLPTINARAVFDLTAGERVDVQVVTEGTPDQDFTARDMLLTIRKVS